MDVGGLRPDPADGVTPPPRLSSPRPPYPPCIECSEVVWKWNWVVSALAQWMVSRLGFMLRTSRTVERFVPDGGWADGWLRGWVNGWEGS